MTRICNRCGKEMDDLLCNGMGCYSEYRSHAGSYFGTDGSARFCRDCDRVIREMIGKECKNAKVRR